LTCFVVYTSYAIGLEWTIEIPGWRPSR